MAREPTIAQRKSKKSEVAPWRSESPQNPSSDVSQSTQQEQDKKQHWPSLAPLRPQPPPLSRTSSYGRKAGRYALTSGDVEQLRPI